MAFVGVICDGRPRKRFVRDVATCASERVVFLGGTGKIGTAAAAHLLSICPDVDVVLAGRDRRRGEEAVKLVKEMCVGSVQSDQVHFHQTDGKDERSLTASIEGASMLINTAGPFDGEPEVLRSALSVGIPFYIDVADPIEYLQTGQAMESKSTTALLAAGAFPGLSNLLAMHCASVLRDSGTTAAVRDVDFSYFTAGLGGSGALNLYITNIGFGTPVPTFSNGRLDPKMNAGKDLRVIDFYFDETDESFRRIGRQKTWAWPFPEGATVAKELGISGDSSVRMGTAPDVWNDIMGIMVDAIPRRWWQNSKFSQFVADFSEPLVFVADQLIGKETHGMRIDVIAEDGSRVSCIQAHESFRLCVGQSVAEFARFLLRSKDLPTGVFTPEQLLSGEEQRAELLTCMTSTPGTLGYRIQKHLNVPK